MISCLFLEPSPALLLAFAFVWQFTLLFSFRQEIVLSQLQRCQHREPSRVHHLEFIRLSSNYFNHNLDISFDLNECFN